MKHLLSGEMLHFSIVICDLYCVLLFQYYASCNGQLLPSGMLSWSTDRGQHVLALVSRLSVKLWYWLCAVRTDTHCYRLVYFENTVISVHYCLLTYPLLIIIFSSASILRKLSWYCDGVGMCIRLGLSLRMSDLALGLCLCLGLKYMPASHPINVCLFTW